MLLIDSNTLCYSAFFKTGQLDNGIIFGFLREVKNIAKKFKDHKTFCFAWDSKKSLRKLIYPEYKEGRKTKQLLTKEDYEQFSQLREEILPTIGFKNIYMKSGYEADDIIAILCKYKGKKVIVSPDQDLYQLLSKSTVMYKPKAKKIYTKKDFEKEYHIDPKSWIDVKAIAGCSSDNIKGVPRVGEITAIKILLWDIDKDLTEYEPIIERNKNLVKLPFENLKLKIPVEDKLNLEEFKMVCHRFGFSSILSEIHEWKKVLFSER